MFCNYRDLPKPGTITALTTSSQKVYKINKLLLGISFHQGFGDNLTEIWSSGHPGGLVTILMVEEITTVEEWLLLRAPMLASGPVEIVNIHTAIFVRGGSRSMLQLSSMCQIKFNSYTRAK